MIVRFEHNLFPKRNISIATKYASPSVNHAIHDVKFIKTHHHNEAAFLSRCLYEKNSNRALLYYLQSPKWELAFQKIYINP